MRRGQAVVGLVIVAVGSFLLFAPAERLAALRPAAEAWPFVLLSLALFNLLRGMLAGGRWIAPLVLGVAGGIGAIRHLTLAPADLSTVRDVAIAVAIVLGATMTLTVASSGGGGSFGAFAVSRVVAFDEEIPGVLRSRAMLAELRLDLSQAEWSGRRIIRTTALLGRVEVTVPRQLVVRIADGGWGVSLGDTGSIPDRSGGTAEPEVTVRIGGLLGRVDIVRT